jgi:tRNA threonylcarbamoyladenosine biosynthesis protein TsaB
MTILLLETATQICSAALEKDSKIIAEKHSDVPNAHSSMLSVFIDELFKENNIEPNMLDAVCVSSGPGSYTGLRIGVSSAKGLCYALDIPLLSIPTMQNMATLYYSQHPDYNGLVCPMIDARRMECYTAIYNRNGVVRETAADIIEPGIYDKWLNENIITFIGDGAEKTKPILSAHTNALYNNRFTISAAGMATLAEEKFKNGEKEDTAYFEPFYLKDFVAKKSIVHGLKKE